MSPAISRTCTELGNEVSGDSGLLRADGRTLNEFRSTPAYVLLGDPGAGKTTEFDRESKELGDAALMLSAKDFIELDLDSHPEWRDRILFIDGLDEMRAGNDGTRASLGEIRSRLDRLRRPDFRIACREADWLGHSDRQSLEAVSRDSRITVLRLDELDDQQVAEVLLHRHNQADPQEFIDKARQHGVGGLLLHPLTLRLLVDAVRLGRGWPDSRRETLEMACQQIATEHNQERRATTRPPQLETVVNAAGYLCALQLLSGIEGYVLFSGTPAPSLASLTELRAPPAHLTLDDLEYALGTKLFRGTGEGFVPLHRHLAEFLAGRFLDHLIANGLPARRVVSLMTGKTDDRVVTSLRGLSAWLAAHSREARQGLIDADPVGVGLYGDIGGFSQGEKERLLESLSVVAESAPLLDRQHPDGRNHRFRGNRAWAFRCLATADMIPAMRELLISSRMTDSDNRLTELILETLSHAEDPRSVADLIRDMEAILWSDTATTAIKRRALDAYVHIAACNDDRTQTLVRLLDDIQAGSTTDPDDEVRGGLLKILYPQTVTPAEVWRYAPARMNPSLMGRFWMFWYRTLLDKSSDHHLAELLDSLHLESSRIVPGLEQSRLEAPVAELLARCLEVNGDDSEPAQIYRWLAAAEDLFDRDPSLWKEKGLRIRLWLEARPHIQKEIVLAWLRQRGPDDSGHRPNDWFCKALDCSTLPPDFGLWCLDQALKLGDTEPRVSMGLLSEAHRSMRDPSASAGLTLEAMRERLQDSPTLSAHLESLCERHSSQETSIEETWQRERRERLEKHEEEQRQRSEDWATHLRAHQHELLENRFSPQNLDKLARVYFGLIAGVDRNELPRARIRDFIGGDLDLADVVMQALRDAVWRDDLPEVDQTVSWSLESRHSVLAYPVLASLKLLDSEEPALLDALSSARKRKALAIYYCVPKEADILRWHGRWLSDDPDLVLGVLYQCAVADVRSGRDVPSGLNELDSADILHDQAHDLRLRLLAAFPTRSSNQQLPLLDRLLNAALYHHDHAALLALARRKQASTSMPIGQRVRWWATDALLAQGPRLQQLSDDLANSEVRVRHLAEFLRYICDRHELHNSIPAHIKDPAALRQLIEILGHRYGWLQPRSGSVTFAMSMSYLIADLIRQLGSGPADEAQQALTDLIENPSLNDWRPFLRRTLEEIRVIHRDASYRYLSVEEVQDTLDDGPPASAADLAALLENRLTEMCEYARGSNSDFWRQFWNEDRHRRVIEAKPEDSCRDALLSNLQLRLPDDVDAAREGSYAADTRADIRASCRGFNVPIEIKKDSHPDLWTAMSDQLMARYTTDAATDGYGIYLVLWFAEPDKPTRLHSDGSRPTTPEELRCQLEQELTSDQARKITVIVMDVTKPSTRADAGRTLKAHPTDNIEKHPPQC